jgi:hypothetical protein
MDLRFKYASDPIGHAIKRQPDAGAATRRGKIIMQH